MAHLSSGGQENPAPPEWMEHILCDRYKWPPETVQAMPLPEILKRLSVLAHTNKAENPNG